MPPMLLRKQRLIGEIAPDSGRIVELPVFSGFQKGTLAASHRRASSVSLRSREPWECPAGFSVGARPPRCGSPQTVLPVSRAALGRPK
jgi:hypothetical protein